MLSLNIFSSLIQLFGALYFGFIGLNFLSKFYNYSETLYEETKFEINNFFSSIKQPEKLKASIVLYAFKFRFDQIFKTRITEIFVKAGLFSVMLLFDAANTTDNYFSILLISIFFICNIMNRSYVFIKKIEIKKVSDGESVIDSNILIDGGSKSILEKLFNSSLVYNNLFHIEVLLRSCIFSFIILILYHIPFYYSHFFDFLLGYFHENLFSKVSIIFALFVNFSPYLFLILLVYANNYITKKLAKEAYLEVSKENELVIDNIIKDLPK